MFLPLGFLGLRGHADGSEFEFLGQLTLSEGETLPELQRLHTSKGECLFSGVWGLVVSLVGGFLEPVREGGLSGVSI